MLPTVRKLLLTIALLTLLAGCTPTGGADPETSPPATETASPSVTPSATPTPEASGTTITPDGIGDLVPSEPVPADTVVATFDPAACNTDTNAGQWTNADPAYPFVVSTVDGESTSDVTSLGVFAPGVRTTTGIQVGSTGEELIAAYPSFDQTIPSYSTTIYVLNGVHGHLIIEVGLVGSDLIEADQADRVMFMRAEPRTDEVRSIANGDGYGNCHG
jgi:hypothetical protein